MAAYSTTGKKCGRVAGPSGAELRAFQGQPSRNPAQHAVPLRQDLGSLQGGGLPGSFAH